MQGKSLFLVVKGPLLAPANGYKVMSIKHDPDYIFRLLYFSFFG